MTIRSDRPAWEAALTTLAEAQVRTEERLAALTARVGDLAAAQMRTEERLAALTARVDALTERVDKLTERVDKLTERVDKLTERVDALVEQMAVLASHMKTLTDQVGELKGWVWEWHYRLHAPAYFGKIVRRIQVLAAERLATILDDAVVAGELSEAEADEVERADLICRGRRTDDNTPTYLVVEVSADVGPLDVERAARRAAGEDWLPCPRRRRRSASHPQSVRDSAATRRLAGDRWNDYETRSVALILAPHQRR